MRNFAGFCGRLLIAALFAVGAAQKLVNPAAAQMLLEAFD